MQHVVFAVPYVMENTLRFARAVAALPGVRMSVISQDGAPKLPAELRSSLAGFARVDDALDSQHLATAVQSLGKKVGPVDRLFGILEPLQEPLAEVRERLGIRGMDSATSTKFRDKARMKEVFAAASIPCAGHRLCATVEEAVQFANRCGYPLVGKPPAGAGAKATARCDDEGELRTFLAAVRPAPGREVLLEEFVLGREFSFDSLTLNGKHVLHNICCYYPTPLEVMDNPWIQWCVVLPRSLQEPEFQAIHDVGPKALNALGMWTGISHMEWFRRHDGTIAISEVAARPPGAQFVSLMGHVHDVDMYQLYAELMVFEKVRVPQRRYAAGAAYLRGQHAGKGKVPELGVVSKVTGLREVQASLRELIVESKLPVVGQSQASTYEGDGYIIVRHPDTNVVRAAVQEIVRKVRVEVR